MGKIVDSTATGSKAFSLFFLFSLLLHPFAQLTSQSERSLPPGLVPAVPEITKATEAHRLPQSKMTADCQPGVSGPSVESC